MTKQTLEERLKEEFVNGATKWELTDYQIKRLWSWFERNIQSELQANDDAWRERIAGFPKKMEFNPETDNLEIDIIKAYKFFTNLKKNKLIIY